MVGSRRLAPGAGWRASCSQGLTAFSLLAAAAALPGCGAVEEPRSATTRVVSVSPRHGARDIDPRTIAEIHFSTGLELGTITADAIRLLGPESVPVPARLGHDIEGDVVNIQPAEPLRSRTA